MKKVGNLIQYYFCQSEKPVLFYLTKHTATITLHNPQKRNPLFRQVIHLLSQYLQLVSHNQHIRVNTFNQLLLLKSKGPIFCSGHDLKQFQFIDPKEMFRKVANICLKLKKLHIPTVSILNGSAVAAGVQLCLACDMIMASKKITLSCSGIKFGIFCITPGLQLLKCINNKKKGIQLLITGFLLSSLVLSALFVNSKSLKTKFGSCKILFTPCQGRQLAMVSSIYRLMQQKNLQDAYKIGCEGMGLNIQTADSQQGIKAFEEKRKPIFNKSKSQTK